MFFATPDPFHLVKLPLETLSPARSAEPARREIVVAPAEANAENETAAGEPVERCRLLGEQRRVRVQRREQNPGREPDAFGDRGGCRERDQVVVVGIDQSADRADRAEACILGARRPVNERLALGIPDRVRKTNSDVHGITSSVCDQLPDKSITTVPRRACDQVRAAAGDHGAVTGGGPGDGRAAPGCGQQRRRRAPQRRPPRSSAARQVSPAHRDRPGHGADQRKPVHNGLISEYARVAARTGDTQVTCRIAVLSGTARSAPG